jgi:nicotinamide mononucleotide transporter
MYIKIKTFIKGEFTAWKRSELFWLFIACTVILSLSVYWQDTPTGIICALTGVICVILTGKGKTSCYIFGLVNTLLYAYIAFGVQYYGEVMLNLMYYVPMQFVGWHLWKKNLQADTRVVIKERLNVKWRFVVFALCMVSIGIYGLLLYWLGGSLPFVDSASTILSIVAMILSVKRLMEQWLIWIVVNIITIVMWAVAFANGSDNIATLIMWCVYLVNSIIMCRKWLKESDNRMKGDM